MFLDVFSPPDHNSELYFSEKVLVPVLGNLSTFAVRHCTYMRPRMHLLSPSFHFTNLVGINSLFSLRSFNGFERPEWKSSHSTSSVVGVRCQLPDLLKYEYVAPHFLTQASYEQAAPMRVSPAPDVVTRAFMPLCGVTPGDMGLGSRRRRERPRMTEQRSEQMSFASTRCVVPIAVCSVFWNGAG